MPKVNDTDIYGFDEYPSLLDYLFGTDASDNKKNKSYRLNSIIQLINGVNGKNNLQFIFSNGSNVDATYYNKGLFFTDTNQGNPTEFSKLIINKESLQPINLTALFNLLATFDNAVIKIENPTDPNNVFNFAITNITDEDGFFVFDVTVLNGFALGNLINETIYSFYFDIKNDSDTLKLDKDGYTGTAKTLNDSILAITIPDTVLKTGEIAVVGLEITIAAEAFQWRLNQVEFLSTPAFIVELNGATANFHRTDRLEGDNTGNYFIVEGVEDETISPPPPITDGRISLALIPIFGEAIGTPSTPIAGDNFISKISQSPRRSYDNGIIDLENETRIILYTCTEINYINHLILGQAYDGRQLFITNENEDESDIVINNLFNHKGNFSFPNAIPFVLKFKETIHTKLFYDFGNKVTYLYVGIIRDQISDITGLTAVLNAKAEKAQFDAHKTDENAHVGLFDAKEDKTQKGVAGGYVPLNEFVKISNEYLTIINDLVTGGSTSLASAETVKMLKTQIDGINTLLTSDNVNLDSVQELVDAIETVQTSLSTILVNDLTTGGTTKALTAEMGKTLKGLIDILTTSVNGKQASLVSGTNLKTVGGVSLLGTGDIPVASSLVTLSDFNYSGGYTFGLTDANKIISQQYSIDSTFTLPNNAVVAFPIGTVLQYHQRGAGAINLVATGSTFIGNVKMRIVTGETVKLIKIDVNTWFMNIDQVFTRELKFDAYPSTRNDGNIPHNKILSTDISGNVKLYSQGTFPKPYLVYLVPDTTLPNATAFFTLKGAFFTQTMTVVFTGQTVNFITFISDSEVRVNVTTGAALGMFSVILNNGAEAIYNNAFTITLGTIYIAQPAEWINKVGVDTDTAGEVKMTTFGIATNAEWNRVLDYTKNWILRWNVTKSPLGVYPNGIYWSEFIKVMTADGTKAVISHQVYNHGSGNKSHQVASFNDGWRGGSNFGLELSDSVNFPFELRYQGGIFSAYNGATLIATFTDTVSQNMRLVTKCPYYDYRDIKYIETA
jgi:hypothetical protein